LNGFETAMERWHDYYVVGGGAAAVLLGLLFVSLSLHLDREASEYDVLFRVGVQTMIDLANALVLSLLMLIPIGDPTVLGVVLLLVSLFGIRDSLRTIARRGRLRGWPHYVSLGCFVALTACAIAFLFGAVGVGLYVTGPSIGLLIIAGTRNTWELLVRAREHDTGRGSTLGRASVSAIASPPITPLLSCVSSVPSREEQKVAQEYEQSKAIEAPPEEVFAWLSDVDNLPDYLPPVVDASAEGPSAEGTPGQRIRTTLEYPGGEGGTFKAEGYLAVDERERRMEWGAEGGRDYSGWLTVANHGEGGSEVVVHLSFGERSVEPEIEDQTPEGEHPLDEGISATLESIRRQIEEGSGKVQTPPPPEGAEPSVEENPAVVDENPPRE
jgi:uncharacterized protein YndB with AHSA1/START domain